MNVHTAGVYKDKDNSARVCCPKPMCSYQAARINSEHVHECQAWELLDASAKVNLTPVRYMEFQAYKFRLFKGGHAWFDDAEDILTGFIWECLEEEAGVQDEA